MNKDKIIFRARIMPALEELARLCRLNENAFITIIETEPGKTVQNSYLPEGSALTQLLLPNSECQAINDRKNQEAERLNEQSISIVAGIHAERG